MVFGPVASVSMKHYAKIAGAVMLLLANHMLTVQVVDKMFRPHRCCAIASSTLHAAYVCFTSVNCRCGLFVAIILY